MFDEILIKYERFADAVISHFNYEVSFESSPNRRRIELIIKCMNSQNDYKWETIKLIFDHVHSFKFIEGEKSSSTCINSALLEKKNGLVLIDFFPLLFDGGNLKENIHSDLFIRCNQIKYEFLSQ